VTTLFISDLHLDPSRPRITDLFVDFLRGEARGAEAVFILGDLFEAWIGDDEATALADRVRAELAALTASGVPTCLLRGNRDFLIGPAFAADTGVRLLADPSVVMLYGEPTLLMHGDLLCSDDLAYQAFRGQVRDPAWQASFLAQPLAAREAFAAKARNQSQQRQAGLVAANTLEAITDVTQATVEETMARYGVTRLIHGHTHRPAIHALSVDGRPARRVVLGDWYEQGSVLRVDADGLALSVLM
jgi:UDP-2,3-diacylglucosamine hydrolase